MIPFKEWNHPESIWIFDYDLTLYGHNESQVLYNMDKYINLYVMKHLGVEEAEANQIRNEYWRKYGTTLAGLRAHGDVDPHDYFDFIHGGESLIEPAFNPTLKSILERIQGRKFVFTNGRKDWAQKGLASIGILSQFEELFDLECSNWFGKPHLQAYQPLIEKLQLTSKQDILFFDDKLDNLKTAHDLGWKTIWMPSEIPQQKEDWLEGVLGHINDLKAWI